MMNEEELAKRLWAVGDAVRLRILSLLPHQPDCETAKNVSQLADELGLSQPAVSHHLRVLRQAGLVSNRKMCRDVYYWVDNDVAMEVVEQLQETFRSTAETSPTDVSHRSD